jgi:hypothetical protein
VNQRGYCLFENVEVFAGLEADGFAGGDGDLCAGAGVASDAGFTRLDGEDTEAAEFDAVALCEGLLHGFEDGVHGGLGLGSNQSCAFYHSLNEVLFDQGMPFLRGAVRGRLRAGGHEAQGRKAMVESVRAVVNPKCT